MEAWGNFWQKGHSTTFGKYYDDGYTKGYISDWWEKILSSHNGDEVKMVASPINYSRSKSDDIKAPQQLGESTDQVLTDYLEYSSLEIDSLRERFII